MIRRLHRLELYNQGLSDKEIAEVENVDPTAIYQWRRYHELPNNKDRDLSIPIETPYRDNRMELYRQGLTYTEIASTLGLSLTAVAQWFRKRGYKPNPKHKDNRLKLYDEGHSYTEIAKILGCHYSTIASWFKYRGYKPNDIFEDDRMELYNQGFNDIEISKKVEVSPSAIGQWRRSRNLKPNKKKIK